VRACVPSMIYPSTQQAVMHCVCRSPAALRSIQQPCEATRPITPQGPHDAHNKTSINRCNIGCVHSSIGAVQRQHKLKRMQWDMSRRSCQVHTLCCTAGSCPLLQTNNHAKCSAATDASHNTAQQTQSSAADTMQCQQAQRWLGK
jgi:hypothetical protein